MCTEIDPQPDNFDLWIAQVLAADVEQSYPSGQVWRRIVKIVQSLPAKRVWRKRGNSQSFIAWQTWYEQRTRSMDMQCIGIGWGLLYQKLLLYV